MSRWKAYLNEAEASLINDLAADIRFAKSRMLQITRRATRRMERANKRAERAKEKSDG